jgi:hypothetical protein
MTTFEVGQEVYLRSMNESRMRREDDKPPVASIVRVGRKLVFIERYGGEEAYRIESGKRNDDYGHEWLQTFEQWEEEAERAELIVALRDGGLEIRMGGRVSTDVLREVVNALGVVAASPRK